MHVLVCINTNIFTHTLDSRGGIWKQCGVQKGDLHLSCSVNNQSVASLWSSMDPIGPIVAPEPLRQGVPPAYAVIAFQVLAH